MLELPGFKGLKKILWKNISPGMIIISGAKVNNTTPPELFNYPIVSAGLIYEISKKYHFRDGKEIIIAEVEKGNSPEKLGRSLRSIEKRVNVFNDFRTIILNRKTEILRSLDYIPKNDIKIYNSDLVVITENVLSNFNSFEVKLKGFKTPSIFNNLTEKITLADIFSKNIIKKYNFPDDKSLQLHVVIDYSKEMFESKYLKQTLLAIELLKLFITECNINIYLSVYGFSDECTPLNFPLSERDLERKGRNYSNFQKKILRHKKSDITNKVLLISCGTPDDFVDSIETGGKLKRGGIDYSQILIQKIPLKSSLEKWKAICMTCNGNQVILKEISIIEILMIEVIDSYLGNLSLSTKELLEPVFKEFSPTKIISNTNKVEEKKKVVKPFEFKKL